jgi:hypothetical protein
LPWEATDADVERYCAELTAAGYDDAEALLVAEFGSASHPGDEPGAAVTGCNRTDGSWMASVGLGGVSGEATLMVQRWDFTVRYFRICQAETRTLLRGVTVRSLIPITGVYDAIRRRGLVRSPLVRRLAITVLVVVMVACGGDDRGVLDAEVEQGHEATGDFGGTLTSGGPASREIDLRAGEALRVWVRLGDAREGERETDVHLAIADTPTLSDTLAAAGYFTDNGFFSDYSDTGFYSDYAEIAPDRFGGLLLRTEHGVATGWSEDPPWFWCGGGGPGEHGAWLAFVAPVGGTYTLLVTGLGDYEIHLDTQAAPEMPATTANEEFDEGASSSSVPYRGQRWRDLTYAHWDFLVDEEYFPDGDFFSDYGPDTAVSEQVC